MPNVRVIVETDEGERIADYPLNNGDISECLEDAQMMREMYRDQSGIMLDPMLEPTV